LLKFLSFFSRDFNAAGKYKTAARDASRLLASSSSHRLCVMLNKKVLPNLAINSTIGEYICSHASDNDAAIIRHQLKLYSNDENVLRQKPNKEVRCTSQGARWSCVKVIFLTNSLQDIFNQWLTPKLLGMMSTRQYLWTILDVNQRMILKEYLQKTIMLMHPSRRILPVIIRLSQGLDHMLRVQNRSSLRQALITHFDNYIRLHDLFLCTRFLNKKNYRVC
jgi:hypothetical protein